MAENRKRRADPDEIKENSDSKIPHLDDSSIENEVLEDEPSQKSDLSGDRDFVKEMQQLNAETDEKMAQVLSNVAATRLQFSGKGMFEQIMDELKSIRVEMREMDRKMDKISKELSSIREDVPRNIRREILGEWKMVEHENFEAFKKADETRTFKRFSENVKYSMENGLLKQTGGGYKIFLEGEKKYGENDLFVKDNHVKTVTSKQTIDRSIENGRLHVAAHQNGDVWKRIYEKI